MPRCRNRKSSGEVSYSDTITTHVIKARDRMWIFVTCGLVELTRQNGQISTGSLCVIINQLHHFLNKALRGFPRLRRPPAPWPTWQTYRALRRPSCPSRAWAWRGPPWASGQSAWRQSARTHSPTPTDRTLTPTQEGRGLQGHFRAVPALKQRDGILMTRDSIVSATEMYVNIEGNKIMPTVCHISLPDGESS